MFSSTFKSRRRSLDTFSFPPLAGFDISIFCESLTRICRSRRSLHTVKPPSSQSIKARDPHWDNTQPKKQLTHARIIDQQALKEGSASLIGDCTDEWLNWIEALLGKGIKYGKPSTQKALFPVDSTISFELLNSIFQSNFVIFCFALHHDFKMVQFGRNVIQSTNLLE